MDADAPHRAGDHTRKGISLAQVHVAMRQAAARLSKTWIDRSDYVKARDLMAGRGRHALPSLHQVDEVLDQEGLTWAQGVQGAGLETPRAVVRSDVGADTAVRAFADALGVVPRIASQLIAWGKAVDLSLSRQGIQLAAVKDAIDALQAERDQQGLPPLDVAARDVNLAAGAADVDGPRRLVFWTKETIIDGMARAVPHLRTGESLSQRTLKRIARDHPDERIPSYSIVYDHLQGEDFSDWCREAERRAGLGSVATE